MVDTNSQTPAPPRQTTRLVVFALVLAVALLTSRLIDLADTTASAIDWVATKGVAGAVVFVAIYIVATVFAIPASPLSLGAGAIYGPWIGFVVVSLGSTLGATAAFLIARYVARDWIARRISGNPRFRALDDGVAAEGWKLVLLTRLSPIFPFNLQNYGYGLTRVPALHYIAASWIGMIPGKIMFVYLGHAAGSVATRGNRSPAQWALLALGVAAAIAVTVVATQVARRALARVPQPDTGS